MFEVIENVVLVVLRYLKNDWLYLFIGIMIAVLIKVYIGDKKFKKYIEKKNKVSMVGAIGFGTLTPLCACGTMAVLLSMFVSTMPWGVVMSFLVSSPLTSPSQFVFQTSFFGVKFASAVLVSSVVLGLLAGIIANILNKKTSLFKNQLRLVKSSCGSKCGTKKEVVEEVKVEPKKCCNSGVKTVSIDAPSCQCTPKVSWIKKYKLDQVWHEFVNTGLKKVLLYFCIFIAIGYLVELIIPKQWIMSLFGQQNALSIPLAATIGLPLYVSGSAALPLMQSFMAQGASQGVLLAFLITGKATGVPVIAGLSTIIKGKALAYYVLFVYVGGIVMGYLYQLLISLGIL